MDKHWKQWQILFSWAPKSLQMVTAAMKLRRSLLGIKVMTNLDSILKTRDITWPTKVLLVKASGFPVVMYGCESWTTKKVERWRIDAFELWCWRRLESPLDSKEIQPVHPKGNSPEYSLEGLMLKLKLHYFGHLMQEANSLEKTLMLGKIEGRRRRGRQKMNGWMASPTEWTWVWTSSRRWWRTGKPGVLQSMGSQKVKTLLKQLSLCSTDLDHLTFLLFWTGPSGNGQDFHVCFWPLSWVSLLDILWQWLYWDWVSWQTRNHLIVDLKLLAIPFTVPSISRFCYIEWQNNWFCYLVMFLNNITLCNS